MAGGVGGLKGNNCGAIAHIDRLEKLRQKRVEFDFLDA
jgi:hypothetical protein